MPQFWYQSGSDIKTDIFDVNDAVQASPQSSMVFSFHKAGSVLINSIIESILENTNIKVIDLPGFLFARGIGINSTLIRTNELILPLGNCYIGFREMPIMLSGLISSLNLKKMLFVRDPRDMMVSSYFSTKYSHPFPESTPQLQEAMNIAIKSVEVDLDSYVINNVGFYQERLRGYSELIMSKNLKIMRYEDFIFDKYKLVNELSQFLGVSVSDGKVAKIAHRYDILPSVDDPNSHVRQVRPGDHKRKLRPETIALLDIVLKDFLTLFNYA